MVLVGRLRRGRRMSAAGTFRGVDHGLRRRPAETVSESGRVSGTGATRVRDVAWRSLGLVLLIVLVGARPAAASPGAFFERVSTYRAHSDAFKNGYAAGIYDAVSMFAAAAQGTGVTGAAVTGLFQCLDQQASLLDHLRSWMAQVAQNAGDQTAMVSAIAQACGSSFTTGPFFMHASDFKAGVQDYQTGLAAGIFDAVSQFAAAAQGLANVNNQKTVAAWKCLDGKGNNLGQLRSWMDSTLTPGAADSDSVRTIVLAACQGTVADLSAPTASAIVNPFVPNPNPSLRPAPTPFATGWYVLIAIGIVAGIYGFSRKIGATTAGRGAAQNAPPNGPAPSPPGQPDAVQAVQAAQADLGVRPGDGNALDRPPGDGPQESPAEPRIHTGLWLWVPGRSPLGLALGSRVSARDLGSPQNAAGADDVAAVVETDPDGPQRCRLRNRSERTWWVREPGADWGEVAPGAAVPLVPGVTMMVGEIRVNLHPWEVPPVRPAWQPRLRIGERFVPVAGDLQLHEYDLTGLIARAGDGVVARVTLRSSDDPVLGLQNLSTATWVATPPSGGPTEIEPGRSIRLRPGMRIACGTATIAVE